MFAKLTVGCENVAAHAAAVARKQRRNYKDALRTSKSSRGQVAAAILRGLAGGRGCLEGMSWLCDGDPGRRRELVRRAHTGLKCGLLDRW